MKFSLAGHVRTHGGVSWGMSADAQVSQHDLTVHAQRCFPPNRKDR